MPDRTRPPVAEISDEEEARIQAQIASDPDNPELTDEQIAQARPFGEVFPELAAALAKRRPGQRGAQKAPTKELVSIRLDRDLLAKLRADGDGWQSRTNAILRKAVGL